MLKRSLKRSWLPALVTTVFVTVGTGCGDECVDQFDCRDKGTPPEGQVYACVENKCELRTLNTPEVDAGTDAGTGTDAGSDAGTGTDAGSDAGTGTDAGTDAGTGPTACNPACALTESCNVETNTCTPSSVTTPPADTSAQIAAFVAAPAGVLASPLPVSGAFVTFIKPEVAGSAATEASGFFLQAEAGGPAMFVRGSASTTTVAVGDRVTLNVTEKEIISNLNVAKTVTDLTVASQNHGVWNLDTATPAGLKVDVNAVSTFEDAGTTSVYESRIVTVSGKLAAGNNSGAAFTAFPVITTGEPSPSPLLLRVPSTVSSYLDMVSGCDVAVPTGVVWRFAAQPQVSVFAPEQLSVTGCPAPLLASAFATSLTQVKVSFSRSVDAASLTAVPTQFTFSGGLQAQSATVSGRDVLVTTSEQTAGTDYTVSVANSVKDTVGSAITTPNSASFKGFRTGAVLRITEVQPSAANNLDLVELQVVTAGTTAGLQLLQDVNSAVTLATLPDVAVAVGDIIVVHIAGTGESETSAKNQFPTSTNPANYDTAWDFKGGTTGITFSSRVILVRDAQNAIQDAVPFARNSGTPPAAFPGNLQAIQAAGQWLPADCGGALCTTATTPTAAAVSADWTSLLGSNATPASNTVRRVSATDTNMAADWAVGAPSWGVANP
ncbi:Ig-like domain-containing protein [Corallococcus caeni]|uniref:SbsA Ig-like domain-containing protein n=1 Tax=Corallococcus caeni TaxID=3082388 RepID=A0ABQ6R3Z3_9BACT|nr:hypothetical protein ASNO1_72980 [Corallococcus sp. NO1]